MDRAGLRSLHKGFSFDSVAVPPLACEAHMLSPSCAGSLDAPRSPFLLISEGILLLIGEFCDLTFSRAVGGISLILLVNSLWLVPMSLEVYGARTGRCFLTRPSFLDGRRNGMCHRTDTPPGIPYSVVICLPNASARPYLPKLADITFTVENANWGYSSILR